MEQAANCQGGSDRESENDDRSADLVNGIDRAGGLVRNRIGLENPGAEQGQHDQGQPPAADGPTDGL